jgi:predicted MPP superfamily phosphohydrolase
MDRIRDRRYHRLRQRWLKLMDALLLNGGIARVSYWLGLHGRLRTSRHSITLTEARLPEPLLIAFVSDLHAGPQTHPALFTRVVDEIIQAQPQVVLLGGDYVSSRGRYIDLLTAELARLRPPLGVYAVLGNHDWWTDDQRICSALRQAGVTVLINENRALPAPFAEVSICGIDDPWTGNADAVATFAGAGPVRIFLTHSPDGLLLLKNQRFDVAFAGHTHGGQIAFADGRQIVTAGGPLSRRYGRGEFRLADNGVLIVSLGIGCSNIPVRINADSEVILCTLHSPPLPRSAEPQLP